MKNKIILIFLTHLVTSCGTACLTGEGCDRDCPSGTNPICSSNDLCICSGLKKTQPDPSKLGCKDPVLGDLVITEVLIDGEPTEKEEFVEIVNTAINAVSLDGISLLSERDGRIRKHILFGLGCLPAGTAIAVYADPDRWIYSPDLTTRPVAAVQSFGFSNQRDFHIILDSGRGYALDSVRGGFGQIQPGISIARERTDRTFPFVLHNTLGHGIDKSPGFCPNGGLYDNGCIPKSGQGCRFPDAGELILNEILIDGRPDATEEFFELHNRTADRINLAGLSVASNRGSELVTRVHFRQGCIEKYGYVAVFADPERWIWNPNPIHETEFSVKRFGFPNNHDFTFVLRTPTGHEIDRVFGTRRLIREGESLRRIFDGLTNRLVRHRYRTKLSSSPGYAP